MAIESNYLSKSAALGYIMASAGCGRPTAEKALNELQASGEVQVMQAGTAYMLLISRADVEKIVQHIKTKQQEGRQKKQPS